MIWRDAGGARGSGSIISPAYEICKCSRPRPSATPDPDYGPIFLAYCSVAPDAGFVAVPH